MKRTLLALILTLALAGGALAQDADDEATLLLFSTVERLLAGELDETVSIDEVEVALAGFPADWVVVGVGSTDLPMRNGEMMPDGEVRDVRFWWADPASESQALIVDLDADAAPPVAAEPGFPFLGLAIADPDDALTFRARDVDSVHAWLTDLLQSEGIAMAGIQLEGAFGPVTTTVAYNIPDTGLDLSGGYVGDDYFRFGDYGPAEWTMNGLYAAADAMHPLVSTAGNPLHLHGYQQDAPLGGHITGAEAEDVVVTVYPLRALRQEMIPAEEMRARG